MASTKPARHCQPATPTSGGHTIAQAGLPSSSSSSSGGGGSSHEMGQEMVTMSVTSGLSPG